MEFIIEPVDQHTYNITIKNPTTTDNLSKIKLKFTTSASVSSSKKTMDIHSLNYTAKDNEFKKDKSLNKAIKELKELESSGFYEPGCLIHQVLLTLDIKQNTNFYSDSAAIQNIEEDFLTKLQSENDITLLQQYKINQLQYVFMEGSLKADLLLNANFEQEVLKYFVEHGGVFCQYTEFVMNGLKRGEKVSITQNDLDLFDFIPSNYIKKVDTAIPDFEPTNEVTTIYPRSYHDMAISGLYTTAMQESKRVQMCFEEHPGTGIVKMTVSNQDPRLFASQDLVVEPTTIYPESFHDMAIAELCTTGIESGPAKTDIEQTSNGEHLVSNHAHRFFAQPYPEVNPIQNEKTAIQVSS